MADQSDAFRKILDINININDRTAQPEGRDREDDLDEDLDDLDDDYDDEYDDDLDEDLDDEFPSRGSRGFGRAERAEVRVALDEGEVIYQRLSARLEGTDAVVARTSNGIRVVTRDRGPIPGYKAFLAYTSLQAEDSFVVQPVVEDGCYSMRIIPREGTPVIVSGLAVGTEREIQGFCFEAERERERAIGANPAAVKMKAGWVVDDTPTVTVESTETLETAPFPERAADEADELDNRDDFDDEFTPTAGGSLANALDQLGEVEGRLDSLVTEGVISDEERKEINRREKRKALGLR